MLHGAGLGGTSATQWKAYQMQAEDSGLRSAASRLSGADDDQKLMEAAREFESLFIGELWKSMRNTVPESEFLGRGNAEKIYQSMLDQEYARIGSQRGGFGLAEQLVRQLTRGMGDRTPASKGPGAAPAAAVSPRKSEAAVPGETGPAGAEGGAGANTRHASRRLDRIAELTQGARAAVDEFEGREFASPVDGRVSSAYGPRSDPFSSMERSHHGLDLAAPGGTPVNAAADGRVVFSGEKRGYGNVVELEHDAGDYRTLYAHNSENLVRIGDRVRRGEVIARVGSTGRSTGPHLHFEVVGAEGRMDPGEFI